MSFIDDKEKMRDLENMTKEDFLKSYSYITPEEYDETLLEYMKGFVSYICKDSVELEDVNVDSINLVIRDEKNPKDMYVLVSDNNYDRAFLLSVLNSKKVETTPEWDFSYADYLYEPLAEGFSIAYIDESVHPVLWEDITCGYDREDVLEDAGMQKYIKYCMDNGITFEKLVKENTSLNFEDLYDFYCHKNEASFENRTMKKSKEKER